MANDRWAKIENLYHAASDMPKDGRNNFLRDACTNDPDLRYEVESLLLNDDLHGEAIETKPPYAVLSQTNQLRTGTRIGPYEVQSLLAEGGMGIVYRATDVKLRRDVALKLLPNDFADDADRLSRFQREAQILAALNHPNIAHVYGLEESAETRCIAMELVEGETLQTRLRQGPVPLDEALQITKQIADALEAAHEKGIVHRDLKPGNVMLTSTGKVKVLDFGLAKAYEIGLSNLNLSNSNAGVILGTAAYMSPEQIRGKPVDKRTDIWSFGCLLYELLSGKQAFHGEDATEIFAAVVKSEPDWNVLPPRSPSALLRRCLAKDPNHRLRDIGDAILEPESAEADTRGAIRPVPRAVAKHPLVWVLALIAAASLGFAVFNRPTETARPTVRLTIPLPPGAEITTSPGISPDGRTVAYVVQQPTDGAQLYLRDLDSFEARKVVGAVGAQQPFFSPDGKWVAFFAQGQLQKAEVTGGVPMRLAEAPVPLGGTWGVDDRIVYAPSNGSGLLRIPAKGGMPETLTKPDGGAKGYRHVFPRSLPGSRYLLFTIWGGPQGGAVLSLESKQWESVLPQSSWSAAGIFDATSGSTGRILVSDRSAEIRAGSFDPLHPARVSADKSVLTDVYYDVESEIQGWLAVSNNRTLVYAAGNPGKTSLVWVDRYGKSERVSKEQAVYRDASLSPDGARAVVREGFDIWIHDLKRGTRSRLTFGTASNLRPIWSPDGTHIIFASNRGGNWDIYSQPADGSSPPDVLLSAPYDQYPNSILADGTLLYHEIHPKTGRDLWVRSPDGKTSPLRNLPFNEIDGQFSPGPPGQPRWVAYSSDESGRREVYVESYPGGRNRAPVSTGGGFLPRWSPDGKELFYVSGDAVVAVDRHPDGSFGAPHELFDGSSYFLKYRFDPSSDGKRFLMIQRDPGSIPSQLNVVLNWPD